MRFLFITLITAFHISWGLLLPEEVCYSNVVWRKLELLQHPQSLMFVQRTPRISPTTHSSPQHFTKRLSGYWTVGLGAAVVEVLLEYFYHTIVKNRYKLIVKVYFYVGAMTGHYVCFPTTQAPTSLFYRTLDKIWMKWMIKGRPNRNHFHFLFLPLFWMF